MRTIYRRKKLRTALGKNYLSRVIELGPEHMTLRRGSGQRPQVRKLGTKQKQMQALLMAVRMGDKVKVKFFVVVQ